MDKRVVELFAGVGGFRLGLERASNQFKIVWSNQWEPSRSKQDAYECYCKNFEFSTNHSNEDISTVDKSSIPDHELLVGGFPCQDYSVARTGAQGIQGKKGVLWWEINEIINEKKPAFVLLENVDRLLKSPGSQRGRDFAVMLGSLNDKGYTVQWRVINASEYGFPQRRRRVFIFASNDSTKYSQKMQQFHPREIVRQEGIFQKQFPAKNAGPDNKKVQSYAFKYRDLVDISNNYSNGSFFNSGCLINSKVYSEELLPDYPVDSKRQVLGDILEKNPPEKFYINGDDEKWSYLKGSKKIERTHRDGHKYHFAEGKIAYPDPLDKPSRTMLTSESSLNRSTHVIEDPLTKRKRKLTPVECERLNGFPDNWTNTGMTEKFRYFCMGNALVVGIIESIGKEIFRIIESE